MDYDLIRLFDHPLRFRRCIVPAIVLFGDGRDSGSCLIDVEWRMSASSEIKRNAVRLSWDVNTIRPRFAEIDEELSIVKDRDDDRATQVEEAAVVVAVAVIAHVEPGTLFTRRSAVGSSHDYYLNEAADEMIEIAGRWDDSLKSLFDAKREQSDKNPTLRKRWVSVTLIRDKRNRTEGLHS